MACFYPMQARKLSSSFTKKGKNVIVFLPRGAKVNSSDPDILSGLPCGQCVGCRLERSRQWAMRMMDEAQLHEKNCFITLTFDEEHLKKRENPQSLDKREFQLFMKRFRKALWDIHLSKLKLWNYFFRLFFSYDLFMWFAKKTFKSPRYFMCGEYGEMFKRPHYHAILFGVDFDDKELFKVVDGRRYFTSKSLSVLWPHGFNVITDVTFDSCAYVARYIMKKALGKNAWKTYFEYVDEETGELVGHRIPEYTTMSRRSGIGYAWLVKYLTDVYPRDRKFMRGRGFSKPPKYYDSLYEVIDPVDHSRLKQARVDAALLKADDNTPARLHAKQAVKLAQISVLKRDLE